MSHHEVVLDEVVAKIDSRARQLHPERYAPDGQPLSQYSSACRHEQDCEDRWADRLAAWMRAQAAAQQDGGEGCRAKSEGVGAEGRLAARNTLPDAPGGAR